MNINEKLIKAKENLKILGMRNTSNLNSAELHILNKEYERAAQSVYTLYMSCMFELREVNEEIKQGLDRS